MACDEKFSAEPDWGGRGGARHWRVGGVGVKRKVGVEVGEVKVMSRQVTRAMGMEHPELQRDR